MSIQSFLDSSKLLYKYSKYEESLCLACIAIDAIASKKYPNKKNNHERYKLFLKENFSIICKYGFIGIEASCIRIRVNISNVNLKTDKDGFVSMEQIIYHILRCGLVHECSIEKTIEFTDTVTIGDWNNKFYIPKSLILGLISSVESNIIE